MTRIMAKAIRDGKTVTVPHAEVRGSSVVREIDGRYVRWSDDSFSLNWYAEKKIRSPKFKFLKYIQYILRTATKREVYILTLNDFWKHAKLVTNEHGEKNYRVPITCFRVQKTETFERVPTARELEKEDEALKQTTLI